MQNDIAGGIPQRGEGLEPTRERDVPAAVNEYDYLVEELEGVVGQLQSRLEGVVLHTPQTASAASNVPDRGASAHYAERVNRNNDRLRGLTESIRYTISVLEI